MSVNPGNQQQSHLQYIPAQAQALQQQQIQYMPIQSSSGQAQVIQPQMHYQPPLGQPGQYGSQSNLVQQQTFGPRPQQIPYSYQPQGLLFNHFCLV